MAGEINNIAAEFMATDEGKKLYNRKNELGRLADSGDGQSVREMLEGRDLGTAFENGDTEAIKNAISQVVSTDAGARLIKNLKELMEK